MVTKTAQLLVEGRYSGVLDAGRHYLPIRRDFSNLDEVLEQARDHALLAELAESAYEEVHQSGRWSFRRLSETIAGMVEDHARPRPDRRPGLRLVRPVAKAQSSVERVVLEPVTNVLRVGAERPGEAFAAARLLLTERKLQRLFIDYAGSAQARENISPRVVLADLVCLAVITRSDDFDVRTEVEAGRHRVLMTSVSADGVGPSAEQLARLLSSGAWEFYWDHSGIGQTIDYPLLGPRSLTIQLPDGPRPLPTLSWVARSRPGHVVAALSPLLTRP